MTAHHILDVRQALGAFRGGFEYEPLTLTGQPALAVMNSDHPGLVGELFRGGLMAEVADQLSEVAVWCRSGNFRARIEHAPERRTARSRRRSDRH